MPVEAPDDIEAIDLQARDIRDTLSLVVRDAREHRMKYVRDNFEAARCRHHLVRRSAVNTRHDLFRDSNRR